MNVVTVFPFWPGNVGLVQAAIAVSLSQYGVAYGRGFAFGIGLQAIEASVGIGIGTLFLAREGLSYASLKSSRRTPRSPTRSISPRAGRSARCAPTTPSSADAPTLAARVGGSADRRTRRHAPTSTG